jgi:hypothetical protein
VIEERVESDLDHSDASAAQRGEVLGTGGQDGDRSGGGEGGGAEHGVAGVLAAVQAGVGEEGDGALGDGVGDRLDDDTGGALLQRRPVGPGVDHLHESGGAGDHRRSSARARARQPVTMRSRSAALVSSLAVEDQGAAGYGGG